MSAKIPVARVGLWRENRHEINKKAVLLQSDRVRRDTATMVAFFFKI